MRSLIPFFLLLTLPCHVGPVELDEPGEHLPGLRQEAVAVVEEASEVLDQPPSLTGIPEEGARFPEKLFFVTETGQLGRDFIISSFGPFT